MRKPAGFTLAELLVALAILGVIATFAIPKVLGSQQDAKYKAIGKEVAGMIAGAYEAYKAKNATTVGMGPHELYPYMNYVRLDSSSTFDDPLSTGGAPGQCGDMADYHPCLKLHNGALLVGWVATIGGTTDNDMVNFGVDVDGKFTGTTEPMLWFDLTYPGRLRTWGATDADPTKDPPWWNWN